MPGLLQTEEGSQGRLVAAVAAEFAGSVIFAFIGGAAAGPVAAAANGLALAVLVYVTANVSGGHLNPAVTFATMITGHASFSRGLAYLAAQVTGATAGSALHLLLMPSKVKAVGCFGPMGVSMGQAFGWEAIMTFLLVTTVYSVAVGEPSFGNVGPLAIGLALYACALAGGPFTGAGLNPARVLGPAIVFGCWKAALAFVLAELLGGALGAVVSWPLYGTGLQLGRWLDSVEDAARQGYERIHEGAATVVAAARGSVNNA